MKPTDPVYLKPNILAEPLIDRWHAWPNLIHPLTGALYLANRHIPLMRSFVAAPDMHAAAANNPAMLGGQFVGHPAHRAGDVGRLLDATLARRSDALELASAVKELDALLAAEAAGHSLEPLYGHIPGALRGYVELAYDRANHPTFRPIEGLLYRGPHYNPAAQSMALSPIASDDRPFVFSTPRLDDPDTLFVALPFDAAEYDDLFAMKRTPRPPGDILERLGLTDSLPLERFFTVEPPPRPLADRPRLRYFGHACVSVETGRTTVLCDPAIPYPVAGGVSRYTSADLPDRIDAVLITHNHQDHCLFETLLQERTRIGTIVVPKSNGTLADPSLKLVLNRIGFRSVVEIDELETIVVGDLRVTGIPFLGEHGDLQVRSKTAFLIEARGRKILCAADSNNLDPRVYDVVREVAGEPDILFLGMECDGAPLSWVYGPLLAGTLPRKMDQSRRLNGSDAGRAMDMVASLRPKQVFVYAMGQEPWLKYLTTVAYTPESRPIVESDRLVAMCRDRGVPAERLFGCREIAFPT